MNAQLNPPINNELQNADAVILRRRGFTLALLTLTYFFSFMDRQILAILLEPIKKDLSLSDTQLGLLSGLVFAIFYATLGVPIARVADRANRRNIIAASLAIWSVMTALCGLAQNFLQLLLLRIGVGVGEAGAGPPSQSIIADLYPPEKRASAMAIYSLGVLLGGGVGIMIGGNVAHAYGWRAAMMIVGIPGVALSLIVWKFVVEPRRGLSDAAPASDEQGLVAPGMWQSFLTILREPAAIYLVGGLTLTSLVGYALIGWGPSYMQRSLGLSALQVANYVAIPASLAGGASAMIGGTIADYVGRRQGLHAQAWVVAAMQTVAFPFAVSFYYFDAMGVAMASYFVSLLFSVAYLGPTYALIQHLAPLRLRAMWAALAALVTNLIGLGLGPVAVGKLSDWLLPAMGQESLRYAMLTVTMISPVPILFYWRAGVLMKRRLGA